MFGKLAEPELSNEMLKVTGVERAKTPLGVIVNSPPGHSEASTIDEYGPSVATNATNANSHLIFITFLFFYRQHI
jgi:hypothetical protein